VSSPTLQRRTIRGSSPRRLRQPQFLPTSRRHPHTRIRSLLFFRSLLVFLIESQSTRGCGDVEANGQRQGQWQTELSRLVLSQSYAQGGIPSKVTALRQRHPAFERLTH